MEFGICVDTHIDKWDLIRYVEELGYDRAWMPDSQMIWSDCYAVMALATQATKRIKIGTGVAIPGTRMAPVTAHSIATINESRRDALFLGIGTGHTAMRVMGQHPMRIKEFREYLRVIRALLNGEAVEYTYHGRTPDSVPPSGSPLHRSGTSRSYLRCRHAPKACEATGAYGDGWVTAGGSPAEILEKMTHHQRGRAQSRPHLAQSLPPPRSCSADVSCARANGSPTTA